MILDIRYYPAISTREFHRVTLHCESEVSPLEIGGFGLSRPLRQKSKKRPSGRFFRFGLSSDTERFQRLLPASRNVGSGGAKPADLLQNV